ncbi:redox-regulated ATPase YchF [Mycoplasma anatis]|uniref:Ribosome-binding ATPase YchF n=1 Tax=Mycoplasmopsis anatis TaxID=171279 RepID=A0A9Q3QG60_9BACT|nr:redox-regulated ATPase YchF [Mycoplasmopsis anatis]MBW0595796.1 redox-regulated ATPase YchF [Mycoplasmopsis anatis]MBW0596979.1 redox-regulated ATPase YchF [Mycoplasmopsis anatis]MBW0599506.1 redox-regulated ATPase YchF [Mycoplasmopsis anatis]MBW0600339.1 redox-regulated ATPase YchF [Mycoplasmopsis anatis]MBW0602792.1 redox-regulated ATPase YchF [Mycoplasmopsis anatis]
MSLKAGIVGLPNVGKSTLFSALTKKQVEAQNYAFTTIEPNISSVALKDPRINKLAELINPKKVVYATFDFVDIAGLVEGASKGEGLGNKFLSNIREVDAIIHVVRCFENKNIMHVANSVDPARDQKIINLELILADLETINNVLHRVEKKAKSGDKIAQIEKEAALKIKEKLESEKPAREVDLNEEELKIIKGYQLLTLKPIIYVANLSNEQIVDYKNDPLFNALKNSLEPNTTIIPISVQMESELIQIEDINEAKEFLSMYNVERSGLDILTRESFNLLNLETYFTAGEVEVRAWVYNKGMLAPQCAGIIHSDFEKKFIKAEVISYNDFIEHNGELGAKAAGKMRQEGKNYVMQDGDICHFRFGK